MKANVISDGSIAELANLVMESKCQPDIIGKTCICFH